MFLHTKGLFALGVLLSFAYTAVALTTLTDEELRNIPHVPNEDFDINTGGLLAPILIPRVSGTEGAFKVQQHFVEFFRTQLPEWEIIFQNSTSTTPVTGNTQVPFTNLIFRRDPPDTQAGDVGRLTLVAHYDSKYSPTGFIGATDSAAPCAILMHVARSIEQALKAKWAAMQESGDDMLENPEGVQILLLDGEEAFKSWTATDSLYGARYADTDASAIFRRTDILTYQDHLPSNGRPTFTPPCPTIARRSTPLASLFFSISSARRTPSSHPTSSPPTGLTPTWETWKNACATWICSSPSPPSNSCRKPVYSPSTLAEATLRTTMSRS